MPVLSSMVPTVAAGDKPEQDEWTKTQPDGAVIERRVREQFEEILGFLKGGSEPGSFSDFERALITLVFRLARQLCALFLCLCEERSARLLRLKVNGRTFVRRQAQSREVRTFFGKVRYWRTYMHGSGSGFYPLDERLKLPAEGFTVWLTSLMARVATKVSYDQTCLLLSCFLGWAPSKTTVERAVLGLGRSTAAWFAEAPVPAEDGDVLVVMVDSKATPTATEAELRKRRGKRREARAPSPRHRGRELRRRRPRRKRRKKGDHSKNGRAATLVVMYTLQSAVGPKGEKILKGPINRWVYASYAKKRHVFAVARREADRRGFTADSGRRVQMVIDGEESFAEYAKEFFPEAILTLDAIHAIDYLWKAGRSLHREGSKALEAWMDVQKDRLYKGGIRTILSDLEEIRAALPRSGPGTKGRRERLQGAITYLSKRVHMMNYRELLAEDLEISSGPVEGAVRYVVAQRFDSAGMRWIRERSEALLQLRCIEINGQWNAFLRFVEARGGTVPLPFEPLRIHAAKPAPLPVYGLDREEKAA